MRCDPLAGAPIPVDEFGRLGRYGDQRLQKPEALEFAGPVRRQRHRRANLGKLVSLLEDVRGKAAPAERKRQREAAHSGADDRDARLCVRSHHDFNSGVAAENG